MSQVVCFIPCSPGHDMGALLGTLAGNRHVTHVYLMGRGTVPAGTEKCSVIECDSIHSTDTIRKIASRADTEYSLVITEEADIVPGQYAIERFISVAGDTGTGIVYSDHYDIIDGKYAGHPVIDYQPGSLRDDFDFGPVLFFSSESLKRVSRDLDGSFRYAGLYSLRLGISREHLPVRVPEFLYASKPWNGSRPGDPQFGYVDPGNRSVQAEMEQAVTAHLNAAGALLRQEPQAVDLNAEAFDTEASVIIPVLNREKTIADAIESVMAQKAGFRFNLLVVNNHSTDRTGGIIDSYARSHKHLAHIIPGRKDLGIGGCWNLAVHDPRCGRFAVQLDSDDLYGDETTLERIIETFHTEHCARRTAGTMRSGSTAWAPPGPFIPRYSGR
jgi:hypothetical protein